MCDFDGSWKKKAKALQAELDQLKIPFPEPAGTIGIKAYRDICQAAALYKDDISEVYIPDINNKVYNKQDMINYLGLDETDKIVYVPETMDCDDSAAILFGKGVPEIWTDDHAINYFITLEGVLYYVEPQTDIISVNLVGLHIRFFLGR